jgi:hypothetical protein
MFQIIENAKIGASVVKRLADGAFIPMDDGNRDYQGYLAWVALGNEAEAVVIPASDVPQIISDRQFFQALALQGVITEAEALDAVGPGVIPAWLDALIDTLPEDQRFAARMLLRGATIFERSHPMVAVLGVGMGWSDAQIDALWAAAAQL